MMPARENHMGAFYPMQSRLCEDRKMAALFKKIIALFIRKTIFTRRKLHPHIYDLVSVTYSEKKNQTGEFRT